VIAVELGIVPSIDTTSALAAASAWAAGYLELPNYANNWRRLGFGEDDVIGGGSEELLRAAIAWGDADTICERVRAHLDAGADHVCVQVLEADDTDTEIASLVALAPELLSV
jgi:probable F420-dependent oxidoreductase